MKHWIRWLTLLCLLALLAVPSSLRPVVHSAPPRLVVFEGFYSAS